MKDYAPMSDQGLSADFAIKVAGWRLHKNRIWLAPGTTPKSPFSEGGLYPPPFATSADAVLPLLEMHAFRFEAGRAVGCQY